MEKDSFVAEPQAAYYADEPADENPLVEPRFERIYGVIYNMSSPSYKHQYTASKIWAQLDAQLSKHDCLPIIAPFDVHVLYDKGDEDTFVQPDVLLACDKSKLENNRYIGAPKFIVEILSSNRSHDFVMKFNLYQKAGVLEYWVVDPENQIIHVFTLTETGYITRSYTSSDKVQLATVPGCVIEFTKVFEGIALSV